MNIYQAALDKFGKEAQLRQAQEELAELTVAISHYLRGRPDSENELLGELADCMIMLAQLEHMFGTDKFSKILTKKVNSLKVRLE